MRYSSSAQYYPSILAIEDSGFLFLSFFFLFFEAPNGRVPKKRYVRYYDIDLGSVFLIGRGLVQPVRRGVNTGYRYINVTPVSPGKAQPKAHVTFDPERAAQKLCKSGGYLDSRSILAPKVSFPAG